MIIWTSSVDVAQTPFEILHLKIYVPEVNPVTDEELLAGVVIVGTFGPDTNVQLPVPVAGTLAANVAEFTLHKF